MTLKRLLLSLIVSQLVVGCYFTPRVWQKEDHYKSEGRDFTESSKNVDSSNIYYSSKRQAYCISYRYKSDDKIMNKYVYMPLNIGRPITYHDTLLKAQNDFKVIRKFAEYRHFKRLPLENGPYSNQDWQSEILTIGIYIPISFINDQADDIGHNILKRDQKKDSIQPSIGNYYPGPGASFWPTADGIDPSRSLLFYLFRSNLKLSPEQKLDIQPLAWLDKDGYRLLQGDPILKPYENQLLLQVTTETRSTYYRYSSNFYSALEMYGQFNPLFQNRGPNVYLIKYDKETNQALIGFQIVKSTFNNNVNKITADVDCTTADWLPLVDSDGSPYPLVIMESEEKRVYRHSPLYRTLMTPLAVAGDVVIIPPYKLLFLIGFGIWGD